MSTHLLPRILVAAVLVVCLGAVRVFAQKPAGRKIMLSADDIEGQPYTLEELGALVVSKNGELQVMFATPADGRLKVYRGVDIQEGDRIMMVNGKKAGSTEDLKTALSVLEVGDEIKLGIKRGKDMKIISFPKADAADMPPLRRMVVTDEGGDKPRMAMREGDIEEEVSLLVGSGLVAREGDDGPEIAYLMPDAADILGDADVKEGDRIIRVQGRSMGNLEELSDAWDMIEVGDQVDLVLARNGKEFTLKFARAEGPKPGGMMMLNKK